MVKLTVPEAIEKLTDPSILENDNIYVKKISDNAILVSNTKNGAEIKYVKQIRSWGVVLVIQIDEYVFDIVLKPTEKMKSFWSALLTKLHKQDECPYLERVQAQLRRAQEFITGELPF